MAIENIGGMNMVTPKYQRVVLKLSGEALAGDVGFGIKPPVIKWQSLWVAEISGADKSEHKWAWNVLKLITWVC